MITYINIIVNINIIIIIIIIVVIIIIIIIIVIIIIAGQAPGRAGRAAKTGRGWTGPSTSTQCGQRLTSFGSRPIAVRLPMLGIGHSQLSLLGDKR